MDSLVQAHMQRHDIPGLAMILVRDGEIRAWAHGLADVESGRDVDVDVTRFQAGSISKIVTATAAMLLVDRGLLELEGDVNRFLDAPLIPERFDRPVSLLDLLTHTAGFESRYLGIGVRSPDGVRPLAEFLAEDLPDRVLPPGAVYRYSQHGFGIVGAAVEAASGLPFGRAMQSLVLEPSGMGSSSFDPHAILHPDLAIGYDRRNGVLQPVPPGFHQVTSAAGLVVTPMDLGRFIATLLGMPLDGEEGGGLLEDHVRATLLARQYAPHPHPDVEGPALGLYEYRFAGDRALTTRGWTGGHSAYLHVIPERGVGIAFLANNMEVQGLELELRELLHGELLRSGDFPREGDSDAADSEVSTPVAVDPGIRGRYRGMTLEGRGLEAIARAFTSPSIRVDIGADGEPVADLGTASVVLTPVAEGLYHTSWQEGREQYFAFIDRSDLQHTYLHWGVLTYERIGWWQAPGAHVGFMVFVFAGFAAGVLGPLFDTRRRWIGMAVGLAGLAMMAVVASQLGGRYEAVAFGLPWALRMVLWIPLLQLPMVALLLHGLPGALREIDGGFRARSCYLMVTAAGTAFVGYALVLGLLPIR